MIARRNKNSLAIYSLTGGIYDIMDLYLARMAELVYAFDLKSNGEIHMGSNPISGTMIFEYY